MKKNHNFFLNKAFKLAEKNLGKTGLNPSVGCIIVKDNKIISSGITSPGGRPHAEYNALKKRYNFIGANLYSTLEPCTHKGQTPPCTNLIIKKKINNVFYSFDDLDMRTHKKAKKKLKKRAINVKKILIKKYSNFYKDYFFNKKYNIPFITAKIAISKDFYTINKNKKWITNSKSRTHVHFLRSKHDCIMSTSKSINLDNSLLNCRLVGQDIYKPDLFIIDLNLKLKKNLLLNKLINKRKTYIITHKSNLKKINTYKKKGYKFILINSLKEKKDFILLYKIIYKLGYSRIFLETGLTFLRTVIKHKLVNKLYLFKNNTNLKKIGKNNNSVNFLKKITFKSISINLNHDKLLVKEF